MTATTPLVGGDEFIEPFLLEDEDGEILDLTGLAVTGWLRWRGKDRIALTGAELDVRTMAPERAVDPAVQDPHGFVHLLEEQTAVIPVGALTEIFMTVVDDEGVTLSTYEGVLERIR